MTRLGGWLLLLAAAVAGAKEPQGSLLEGHLRLLDWQSKPRPSFAGIIVYLDELEHPIPPPALPPLVISSLREKRFVPELLPILVGTTVVFLNEDTLSHNVFSLSKVKTFDLGIFGPGQSRSVSFDRPGLVTVYCNIHPQVAGWLMVLANPFFTTTDQEGRFSLPGVPLGTATLRAWSPRSHHPPELRIRITPQGILDLEMGPLDSIELKVHEDAVSVQTEDPNDAH